MKMFNASSFVPALFLILSPLAAKAQPSRDRTIHSFSVMREGGGDLQVMVSRSNNGSIIGETVHCQFHALTPAQQKQSAFVLSGEDAAAATAILDDQATLAERTQLLPMRATGTWLTISIDYTYMDYGSGENFETSTALRYPIVLFNDRVSSVVANVETAARAANHALCN